MSKEMGNKPKLLDLFCGAGGASEGYSRAGFDVVGVDIKPQPHYPFSFIQTDAVDLLRQLADSGKAYTGDDSCPLSSTLVWRIDDFDAYHASPPCQAYTRLTPPEYKNNHPDLLELVCEYMRKLNWLRHKLVVIENVPDALFILENPLLLCGTMFGLATHRHRYFETLPTYYPLLPKCCRIHKPIVVSGTTRRKTGRLEYPVADVRRVMEIDWMVRKELDEAIPPAYTEYIGKYLLLVVRGREE